MAARPDRLPHAARAQFNGSDLALRDSDTTCNDGSHWYADQLVCRRGSDKCRRLLRPITGRVRPDFLDREPAQDQLTCIQFLRHPHAPSQRGF